MITPAFEEAALSCYPVWGRLLCARLSGESGLGELPREGTPCMVCSAPELLIWSLKWGTFCPGLPYPENRREFTHTSKYISALIPKSLD